MRMALEEAEKCTPTPTAFCVGCVLVCQWVATEQPVVLATGFSRELPGNTHAEANALHKLLSSDVRIMAQSLLTSDVEGPKSIDDILRKTDVYTTMEPCSIRTSGLAPCADALIKANVSRVVIGVGEPDDFVQCEGTRKLVEAGIEVIRVKEMEEECLKVARRGHSSS